MRDQELLIAVFVASMGVGMLFGWAIGLREGMHLRKINDEARKESKEAQ